LKKDTEYEVGYGRPPRHTQFQKGRSGNARGRPRGARSVKGLLREELREKIAVNENGRRRKVTKVRVIVKQVVTKALRGDHRSIQLLFGLLPSLGLEFTEGSKSGGLSEKGAAAIRRALLGQDP
jgi:uncharacterized protein DUF5681